MRYVTDAQLLAIPQRIQDFQPRAISKGGKYAAHFFQYFVARYVRAKSLNKLSMEAWDRTVLVAKAILTCSHIRTHVRI
jgi:hypothetical protein